MKQKGAPGFVNSEAKIEGGIHSDGCEVSPMRNMVEKLSALLAVADAHVTGCVLDETEENIAVLWEDDVPQTVAVNKGDVFATLCAVLCVVGI